jgi:hypothetical protein
VVGDIIEATLIWLFAGEINGGWLMFAVGDGVLSAAGDTEDWKAEPVGLAT